MLGTSTTALTKFHSNYEYDPGTISIKLKSMGTKMDNSQKIYFITRNEDLLPSSIIYKNYIQKQNLFIKTIPDMLNKLDNNSRKI